MRLVLILNRLTRWGLSELLALTWPELEAWLDQALALQRETSS